MESVEPPELILSHDQEIRKQVMLAILKDIAGLKLVLKGGSALYLGYGLNRFSEDLDFDSMILRKVNLANKIKHIHLNEILIDQIKLYPSKLWFRRSLQVMILMLNSMISIPKKALMTAPKPHEGRVAFNCSARRHDEAGSAGFDTQ